MKGTVPSTIDEAIILNTLVAAWDTPKGELQTPQLEKILRPWWPLTGRATICPNPAFGCFWVKKKTRPYATVIYRPEIKEITTTKNPF